MKKLYHQKNPKKQIMTKKQIGLFLSTNPNAIELLNEQITYENNLTRVEYNKLNYIYKIDWRYLSANPNAIKLLKANPTEIDWDKLSMNPNAIDLLKKHTDKINWIFLSSNPNAIELLKTQIKYENNLSEDELDNLSKWQKIDWERLSESPHIFKTV